MICAGDGVVGGTTYVPDAPLACMFDGCAPQLYKRKKVFVEDFIANTCADRQDEICAELDAPAAGPAVSGHHYVEWDGCEALRMSEWGIGSNVTSEDQSDCARITGMWTDAAFACWTISPATGAGCFTIVEVEYTYEDTFSAPYYHSDPCIVGSHWVGVTQMWRCRYARPVATGQKVAIGLYRLIAAEVGFIPTYGSQTVSGLYNCPGYVSACVGAYASAPLTLGTPWHPPRTISVARLC